ncbi:MAG: GTPase ObgE [Bacteroides sp.]|jgi:obg family GTPase cgtA
MAESNFIDYVKIFCRSGHGGAGSAHLRREKFVPKGGPDGGDGGCGGDVIMQGNDQMWTLLHLKYNKHALASNGQPGGKQRSTGANGTSVILQVPLGTVAKDDETGEVIGEILHDGEQLVLKRGGRGGLGNWNFRTATRQTPRFAQPGEEGQEGWVTLELKLLADVGLVGFPNAGKSTLLASLSAARPKVADYPFTTLQPNLGIVHYRDDYSFVMADIPGIIEGAHEGRGLGIQFLRHIERNSILLFLIPVTSDDINAEYRTLLRELELYNPELLEKKRVVAITKLDLIDAELKREIEDTLDLDAPYGFISAIKGDGLMPLRDELWKALHNS